MNSKKVFPKKIAELSLNKIIDFLRGKKFINFKHQILINLANVSRKEIKDLNKKYRNKNEVTDILSFSYNFNNRKLEGDLILCWEIIKRNAQEDRVESEQELIKNLVHGCLHLIGLEHSEKMFELQEEFLKLK